VQDAQDLEMTLQRALAMVLIYSTSVDNKTLNPRQMDVFSRAKKRVEEATDELMFPIELT
jgi:hypothetical protein